jgi:hypothetical protein
MRRCQNSLTITSITGHDGSASGTLGAGLTGRTRMRTQFVRCTFYGIFTVEQQGDGKWTVTRYTDELLQHGETATFATAELARHVADLHEIDGVADYPAIDDGYSWDN